MQLTKSLQQNTSHYTIHNMIREDSANYKSNKLDIQHNKRVNVLKRLPIHRLMDLKIDYAFKQLFGNEKNKQITVVFLNAILQKSGRKPIKDISFNNIEAGGEYAQDKQSRLDLLVVTKTGERINVEIQFTDKYEMVKRSIYYWSGIYRNQLQTGMVYKELHSVISINIMNFDVFDQTNRFHTMYHLFEDEEKFKLTNVMEFHYIEMPKLLKAWKEEELDPWNDILARWLLLLGMVDHRNNNYYQDIYNELEEIAMKDKTLRKAFHNWEELSMTPEQFFAYEARFKHIMDEEAFKREVEEAEQAKQEAEQAKQKAEQAKQKAEQAKQKAERKAKEAENETKKLMAERLLADGFEINYVIKLIDLPKEKVLEIERDLKR